ncbi:MAG: TonB-dependent receptor, partial [Vicinamibacterales bacterium]
MLVSALAFDAVFGIAGAQEAATGRSQPATQLETIVVTARKRTEDIQSVPISVTAVSGTDLENQNVRTVGEVVLTVPNMSVTSGSNSATAPTYTIRGQVQNDTTAAVDPSVGIYVDGVYWARAHGSNAALLDVSQVEVLRGPQGTLFGRNTTGGAINMTTNDPNFDGFSGSGSVGFGNYDQFDFSGVLNMPITADRLAARIAVNQQQNHGWIKDEVTDERYSRSRQWIGRGKLLFTPTDALSFVLSGEYFDYDGGAPVEQLAFILPPNAVGPNGAPLGLGAIEALLESGFTDNGQRHVVDDDSDAIDRISLDRPDRTWTESQTYSLRGALDTEWGTLKSIVAYRKVDTSSKLDLDGTPYEIFNVTFNESNVDQWTGELQASGLALDERLNWTVGAYYFTEDGVDQTAAQTVTAILGNRAASPSGSFIENDSYAGYAQGTYRLTDAWSLTAGLRYSSDERHKRQFQDIANPANPICPAGTTPRSSGRCEAAFKRTDSDWSYTFGLDYQFTPDILGYVKTSRGYRAGGFNTRGGADLPGGGAFGPETVTDYEVGLKSEFLDNRVRLNLAVYYSDYRDIQST